MSLQGEILDGLNRPGWDDSIAAVKRAVSNALRRLDRGAVVTDTNYFNHSFVPDFVLTWPREPGHVRDVFLRLDSTNAFIANDIRYLGDARPVMMGLAGLEATTDEVRRSEFDAATRDTAAMITEPAAVERFEVQPSSSFGQVLPAAVLKGGRGLVSEDAAVGLIGAADGFFAGARTHEPSAVEQSVPGLSKHLDRAQTARLLNFGRVVWEATGGDPSRFPVSSDLAGVDDTGLRFLLDEAPSDDVGFWRSVGRLVTLERLLSLGVRESKNLQPFVRANADRLNARVLLVKASQPKLDAAGPSWEVDAGGLVLRGGDFSAYMAPKRDDLTVRPDVYHGLDFNSFRRRSNREQVDTVTLVAGDGKTVSIESEDIFDPGTDAVLASVGDLPGSAVGAVGLLVDGKHLECEFVSGVASGHTNAVFDVMSLLERALPMLWPLTDERDVDEIRKLRQTVESVAIAPTLFDDIDDPLA